MGAEYSSQNGSAGSRRKSSPGAWAGAAPTADPVGERLRRRRPHRFVAVRRAPSGVSHPELHRERVVGDADAVEHLGAGEEDGPRIAEVRRVVARSEERPDRAGGRPRIGTPSTDKTLEPTRSSFGRRAAVTNRPSGNSHSLIGEPVHGLRVVRRPHAHVSVASVELINRDEVHDPDQDLVVVRVGTAIEVVDRSIERASRHPVEEVRMDGLHLPATR